MCVNVMRKIWSWPPSTSAGVDGEELQVDNLLHISEGKAGWLSVARIGSAAERADLICLSWEDLFLSAV